MAKAPTPLKPPEASGQVTFHELLLATRKTWAIDALSGVLNQVDPSVIKAQIAQHVPTDVQRILATLGIRDEHVFPTPAVLQVKPSLVGYYRLLTGISQKRLYTADIGMSPFSKMEKEGRITPDLIARLPEFCDAMGDILADMIRQIAPALSSRDIAELQLLTLGSYFYGSSNNTIGKIAIQGVLDSITEVVSAYVQAQTPTSLTLTAPGGRTFHVAVASDPDVVVQETSGSAVQNLLSIEVKGGADKANVYNRGGEAEKSHQAARQVGYPECWTVIRTTGIDFDKLKRGSPTTDAWFDTAQVLARRGMEWEGFSRRIRGIMGLP